LTAGYQQINGKSGESTEKNPHCGDFTIVTVAINRKEHKDRRYDNFSLIRCFASLGMDSPESLSIRWTSRRTSRVNRFISLSNLRQRLHMPR